MLVPITIRVPEEVANKIKELSQESNVTESEYLRRVIEKGLKTERQDQVLSAYQSGQIHLSEAARLLDMSTWDFLRLLSERNLSLNRSKFPCNSA